MLPSVPRIFEKVYSVAMGMVPPGGKEDVAKAIAFGLEVRQARERGEEVDAEEAAEFERIDNEMFALSRGIFGGGSGRPSGRRADRAGDSRILLRRRGAVFEGWGRRRRRRSAR